jgi:GntR family transcriptional regulator, transcriptional repressor for pyruvate dehydrogenase complex
VAKTDETGNASKSAVRSAANALRSIVFGKQNDEFIGSEDDLIAMLGVSRPTLRQAAALVCQEQWLRVKRGVGGGYFACRQWLRVKRGVGGGYFACRPDSRAVAHMAAVYLQAHEASLSQIVRAARPIRVELARLAASQLSAKSRAKLQSLLASEAETRDQPFSYPVFLRNEREFGQAMGEASGNQVLSLFLEILYDLAARVPRDKDIYAAHPERVQEYREKRNLLITAILSGDEEMAVLNATRISQRTTEWLLEAMPEQRRKGGRSNEEQWRDLLN